MRKEHLPCSGGMRGGKARPRGMGTLMGLAYGDGGGLAKLMNWHAGVSALLCRQWGLLGELRDPVWQEQICIFKHIGSCTEGRSWQDAFGSK